jgi:hypothetical protein
MVRLMRLEHMEPLRASLFIFDMYIPLFIASQLNRCGPGHGRCQQSMREANAQPAVYWPARIPMPDGAMFAMERAFGNAIDGTASKEVREMQQRLAPGNTMIRYTCWANFEALLNLFNKRLTAHTQTDTRLVVGQMYTAVSRLAGWGEALGVWRMQRSNNKEV